MTVEIPSETQIFNIYSRVTSTQSYDEVTISIAFTFGKKEPDTYSGHAWPIKNGDMQTMEAESFFEAAQKAWGKYRLSAYESRKEFVRGEITKKWLSIKGNELTGKTLELL